MKEMEELEKTFVQEADEIIAEMKKLPGGKIFAKAQEILLSDDYKDYASKPYLTTTQNQRYLSEVLPKNAQNVCVILGAGDTVFSLVSKKIKNIVALEINDLQSVVFSLRRAAIVTLSNSEFENFLLDIKSSYFLSHEIFEKVKKGFMKNEEEEKNFWNKFLNINYKDEISEYFIKGGLEHGDIYASRFALPYVKKRGVYNLVSNNLEETNLRIELKDALDFFGQSSETFDFIDITNILLFVYQMKCENKHKEFSKVVKLLKKVYENNLKPGGTMVLDYMFSISSKELESPVSKVTDGNINAQKSEAMYKNVYHALKEEFNVLETLQVTACCNPIPLKGKIDTVVYVRK